MRPLRSAVAYLAFVFIGGALVAPWLWFGAHWLATHFSWCASWSGIPFHRFVHRSFLGLALVALPRFLRSLDAWDTAQLREAFGPPRWRALGVGGVIGFASLAVALLIELVFGARAWRVDHTALQVFRYFIGGAGAALVVALLEEFLFRWALYGALRKVYSKGFAIIVSSAVYALVHFFRAVQSPTDVNWVSGLVLLPRMLRGFGEIHALIPEFFTLLLVGVALARCYEKSGRLWLSVGLHGGWIFWLKTVGFWTRPIGGGIEWLWGTDKITDGWLGLILVGLCVYIVNAMKYGSLAVKKER